MVTLAITSVSQLLVHLLCVDGANNFLEVANRHAVNVFAQSEATPPPTAKVPDAIEVFMYRASSPVKHYAMENVDLADMAGTLKYIHTEVIAEHTQARPERDFRKYDIKIITQWKVWLRNPESIVNVEGEPHHVDFGQYMTYDYGQATNFNTKDLLGLYGDFVGIQTQKSDRRFAFDTPYYWFSLPGFCPNLPYVCTNGWAGQGYEDDWNRCLHDPAIYTVLCSPDKPCPSKGARSSPRDIPNNAAMSCARYQSNNQFIRGGLCDKNGTHPGSIRTPDGVSGCAYSYDYPGRVEVNLDVLTGITREDCYGGKCQDWTDFRMGCMNNDYKRKFTQTRDVETGQITSVDIEFVSYCVEYDINPYCAEDCASEACAKVPEEQRELGIPFWRGRCSAEANSKRTEALAAAVAVPDAQTAHQVVHAATDTRFETVKCDRTAEANILTCKANPLVGGPYCTRHWSSVCTACYVPGTVTDFPDKSRAFCPYDITKSGDYSLPARRCRSGACCATRDPLHLCCLYYDTCDIKLADVDSKLDSLPLDERTLTLVEATRDTSLVLRFAKRLVKEAHEWVDIVSDSRMQEKEKELMDIAYWQWGHSPSKERPRVANLVKKLEVAFPEVTTGRPTPAPTSTPSPTQPTATPTTPLAATPAPTAPDLSGSGNTGGTSPVVVVLILLLVAATGGGYWFYTQRGAGHVAGIGGGRAGGQEAQQHAQQEMSTIR